MLLAAVATAGEPGSYSVVSRGDDVVIAHAEGFADIENDVPIDGRTVFRIASLTKQFTAVAVLALAEDKRLSLDDALGPLLPDCPLSWRPITVRQLLSHTSGITSDMSLVLAHIKDDLTPEALIAPYRDRALEAPPGARWRYSNVNYWILGLVIARVSGMPYATFVGRRVLGPAGLSATREGASDAIIRHRAHGYTKIGADWRNAPYFSTTIGYAAGGFVASPVELVRWYAALAQSRVISRGSIAEAGTAIREGYGLGWYVDDICGLRVLHHGGSSPGFASYLYWQPESGALAAVFKNHDDAGEPKAEAHALFVKNLRCGASP